MYSYIIGKIKEIKSNAIIIETNNIGYKIFVPNPFSYELLKEEKIYLYNHIREDEYSLYGFKTSEEYEFFLKLLSVKGLGPKVAIPFFATGSIKEIMCSINNEDISYLKKFPKVGEKLAKQIIFDLKGKFLMSTDNSFKEINDLELVLINLGYKSNEIKNVLINIDKTKKIEEQVKDSLKLLMK